MAAWGEITGTLSDQNDLQSALNLKQDQVITNFLVPLGRVTGDINGDGAVSSADLVLLNNHIADPTTYPFDTIQTSVADVNHDGVINSLDSSTLNGYLNGTTTIAFTDYFGNWHYDSTTKLFNTDIAVTGLVSTNSITVFINTKDAHGFSVQCGDGYFKLFCTMPPINQVPGWFELTNSAYSASVVMALGDKQDTLVSGTNIKTINGSSIVGSGNLDTINYVPKSQAWLINSTPVVTAAASYDLTNSYFSYFDGNAVQESQVLTKIILTYTDGNNYVLKFGNGTIFNTYTKSAGTGVWRTYLSSSSYTAWPTDTESLNKLRTITLSSDATDDLLTLLQSIGVVQPKNVTLKDGINSLYPITLTKNISDLSSNLKTINGNSIIGSGDITVSVDLNEFILSSYNWTYSPTGKYYYQDVSISTVSNSSSVSVMLNDSSDKELTATCHDGYIRVYSNVSPTANITGWVDVTASSGSTATVFRNYDALLANKQIKLTAGSGITLTSEGVISASADGKVKDVTLNSTSLLNSEGIAVIPLAANGNPGAVYAYHYGQEGIKINNGELMINAATQAYIDQRDTVFQKDYTPIVPGVLDYAVKAVMTDGVGTAWTSAEQKAARLRLGISPTTIIDIRVNNDTVVDSEGIANIAAATSSKLGVVKASEAYGISVSNGDLKTLSANSNEIYAKADQYKVITPANTDYAVKYGLIDSHISWTDGEKALARLAIGVDLSTYALKSYVNSQDDIVKVWAENKFITSDNVPVKGVKIGSRSIVDSTHIAYIPTAGDTALTAGIGYYTATNGVQIDTDGAVQIAKAANTDIDDKVSNYKPITPANLDYAVKKALTDTTTTWSDTEKLHARGTLGITLKDVYLVGNTCVDSYGIAQIPEANSAQYGVVKVNENLGIKIVNGQLSVDPATASEIVNRDVNHAITPDMLGVAVKEGLGHNNWGTVTWSETEKVTARETIGVPVEDVRVDNYTVLDPTTKIAYISFANLAKSTELLEEVSRANIAERNIEDKITEETARASTIEGYLQTSISEHTEKISTIESRLSEFATFSYVDNNIQDVKDYADAQDEVVKAWADGKFLTEHQYIPVKGVKVDGVDVLDSEGVAQIDLTDKATKTEVATVKSDLEALVSAEETRALAAELVLDTKIDTEIQETKDWADDKFLTEHQDIPVKDVYVNGTSVVDAYDIAQVEIPTRLSGFINDCGFTKVVFDYDATTKTLNIIDTF